MHFYDAETGEPRHYVEMASGEMRPSTCRDAIKNNWRPSVSTIMSLVGDEGIRGYEKEQIIDACWLHPYTCGADVKEWKKKIRQLADIKRTKAAEDGNRIHKCLENYYLGNWETECDASDLDIDIVYKVVSFLNKEFGTKGWIGEKTFVHERGFGGTCDLVSFEGDGIIIDFKVQGTEDINNFKFYDKYCQQLAAYREGLRIPNARCFILKISSTKSGILLLKEYHQHKLDKEFECFCHLLNYFYVNKGLKL